MKYTPATSNLHLSLIYTKPSPSLGFVDVCTSEMEYHGWRQYFHTVLTC